MTCDFIDDGVRCGEETNEANQYFDYNKGHWKHYPLDLCPEHKKRKKEVTPEMLDMNFEILEPYHGSHNLSNVGGK